MGVNDVTEAGVGELMALAEATPQRLAASTAGMDEGQLRAPLEPGEWSLLQILNHLRACEEVWMHSVHGMLAFDNPNLKEIHPRQWIKVASPYTGQSFGDSLKVFTLRREALLVTLGGLSLADWAWEGRIDRKTHTVFSHVRRMVYHERRHCDEIDAVLEGE
jgi:uncharacterized damage-inducible protein DinB